MGSVHATACLAPECDRKPVARGYCDKHRKHIKKYGRVVETWRGHEGCRVEGCDREHDAKGYCQLHWMRVKKHGTPHPRKPTIRERLAEKTTRSGGCLLWIGSRYSNGYGRISYRNRDKMVHRLVFELEHGPIPDGLLVCHRCDTPNCIEPSHLFLGTQSENIADMDSKGRRVTPDRRGARNGRAKATPDQVREVKRLRRETKHACSVIADRVGLPLSVVEQIAAGRTWKHIR